MSYRVEVALSGRSGCHSTECKDAKIKIDKGELRLGTWIEFPAGGGWVYRHWGCVTGKILEHIRKSIEVPEKPGTYQWDMLDGYESGDKNSLDTRPELQEKVRRCITQGFIDAEDWNGDPEMNVLGALGMRTKESMKKLREEKKARNQEIEDLKAQVAALQAEKSAGGDSKLDAKIAIAQADLDEHLAARTPAGKKRANDDAENGTPARKKRATKTKVEAEDEEDEDVKPVKSAPKSRAKKVKKEDRDGDDEEDEDVKPVKSAPKSRAKKVKKEDRDSDDEAEESKPAPAKKPRARARKAAKKEEGTEMSGASDDHIGVKDEEDVDPAPILAPKKRAPARRKSIKAESDEAEPVVKNEEDEASVEPVPRQRALRKKAVKTKPAEDGARLDDAEPKPKPAAKGRKKAVKREIVDEECMKDESAAESNPGITEGSSVLSDPPDLPKGIKNEPTDLAGVAPEIENASVPVAADKRKDLAIPTKTRRTRSRTASNRV